MVKLLCVIEFKGNSVARAQRKLDTIRMQMADNDIVGATIYQDNTVRPVLNDVLQTLQRLPSVDGAFRVSVMKEVTDLLNSFANSFPAEAK